MTEWSIKMLTFLKKKYYLHLDFDSMLFLKGKQKRMVDKEDTVRILSPDKVNLHPERRHTTGQISPEEMPWQRRCL